MSTNNEKSNKATRTVFVVFRDNHQVSDKVYNTKEEAQPEVDYWMRILKKWPDGSKLRIVEMPAR